MKYALFFISLLVIYFVCNGISVFMRRKKENESNTVVLPKLPLIVGIICAVTCLVPAVIVLFLEMEDAIILSAFLAAFSLLGVALIIAYINCRIVYGEDEFTYKTFFGIKKTVRYEDLTAFQGFKKDVKLFVGKRVIRIDELAINKSKFISFARVQYRKKHNGKALPKLDKKDLFNNHVENPGEFILVFVLVGALLLGVTAFMFVLGIPTDKSKFEEKTITVEKYEILEQTLLMYDNSDNTYSVSQYASIVENANEFINALNSKPELTLLVRYDDNDDEPRYTVSAIEQEGAKQYLSYEAWCQGEWELALSITGILLIVNLIYISFVCLTIYVGRNPHKFSDKVLHLFFKPGYIHRD